MRNGVRYLIVLILGSLAWGAETRQKIHEQIAIGEYELARAAIVEYLTFPESEHVPCASWARLSEKRVLSCFLAMRFRALRSAAARREE